METPGHIDRDEKHFENKPFQDQLIQLLKNAKPESIDIDETERNELKEEVDRTEHVVNSEDVRKLMEMYGLDLNRIDIFEDENGYFHIKVKKHFQDKRLPEGYAYKGGAARSLLMRNLGVDIYSYPRDIDVVRLSVEEPYKGADIEVGQTYMLDDFQHGYGIEVVNYINEYFRSRDFTLNEVIATDTEITATKKCLLDTIRNIIRLTEYERNKFGRAGPKMLAKALRLYSEEIYRNGTAEIENIEDYEFEDYFINPFWLAVQMDRSFEQGREIAEEFTQILRQKGQIPYYITTPEEAAYYIISLMRDSSFYYRHAETKQFNREDELIYDHYEKLPKFQSHRKFSNDK